MLVDKIWPDFCVSTLTDFVMERRAISALAVPKEEYLIFDSYFYRNDSEFNPRQRRGDRKNIEYYIERIHEQVKSFCFLIVEKCLNENDFSGKVT